METNSHKRRLFFGNTDLFQLMSFEQNPEGDIYCGFPKNAFSHIVWQTFEKNEQGVNVKTIRSYY